MTAFTDQQPDAEPAPPQGPSQGPRPPRPGSRVLMLVAVVLLSIGVGLLGYVGYQYVGTNIVSGRAFQEEKAALRIRWAQQPPSGARGQDAPPAVLPGDAIALLRIPAFGSDYEVPILSGISLDVLARGVGHYVGTADAGQIGNFAIAGHRVTHGEPFARLLELNRGDVVIVETRDAVYTYVVDETPRSLTVADTDTWVIDPVPGQAGAEPTRSLLTLTTCQDLFHSPDRSVGFAHLQDTRIKG